MTNEEIKAKRAKAVLASFSPNVDHHFGAINHRDNLDSPYGDVHRRIMHHHFQPNQATKALPKKVHAFAAQHHSEHADKGNDDTAYKHHQLYVYHKQKSNPKLYHSPAQNLFKTPSKFKHLIG